MPVASQRRIPIAIAVALSVAPMQRAMGQIAAPAPGTIFVGHVADTAGAPLAEAEVRITRERDSVVVGTIKSGSDGIARLYRIPSGGPYAISVRKIGYKPARLVGQRAREGDTLAVSFILYSLLPEVSEVKTGANSTPHMATAPAWPTCRRALLGLLRVTLDSLHDALAYRDSAQVEARDSTAP